MSQQDLSIPSLFNISGKVALVSGGGSGIGQMIATAFAQNGAEVWIVSRKEKQLKEVSDELNRKGPGKCHYIVGDLGTKQGVDSVISRLKEKVTKLHILVNNSGVTWGAPWGDFPEKEGWDRVMSLNVKSIFYMTAGLSDLLAKDSTNTDPGRVINISSVAGVRANAETEMAEKGHGVWSYNTSKAAVNHLTSQLAVSLGNKNVTVNAILPGVFPSKMTAFAFRTAGEDALAKGQPTGRVGAPRDMAGLALFLVSPASAHVTGAHILLDGGATLGAGANTKL